MNQKFYLMYVPWIWKSYMKFYNDNDDNYDDDWVVITNYKDDNDESEILSNVCTEFENRTLW